MLIIGTGRCGTNWLLNILDASPLTHGRNEPYNCKGSPFDQLPSRWDVAGTDAAYAEKWDWLADWLSTHTGDFDLRIQSPKNYVHDAALRTGIANWPRRPKLRAAMSVVSPRFRKGEWTTPFYVGSQEKLREQLGVFKLNAWPGIATWVLKNRPDIPVVHIVRHPGGRTDSWNRRFLGDQDVAPIHASNLQILKGIAANEPGWAERLGDIDQMSVLASENWICRYQTEQVHAAGEGLPQYKLLRYESLATQPFEIAKSVYEFVGLPWTDDVESTIADGLGVTPWGKLDESAATAIHRWRDRLDQTTIDEVEHILATSMMADWWDDLEA